MEDRTDAGAAQPGGDFAEIAIAATSGLALALAALFLCVLPLTSNIAGGRDFVVYWATGQQLAHHANPYDASAMAGLERAAGLLPGYGVLYMRNPPWGLLLALPLGLIGLKAGAFFWSLALLACLGVSVRLIRLQQGRPGNRLHWLGYSFGPALVCLLVGQTALFCLLGLVLFLCLHRSRPFVAGTALWLCALKPQLFLPFTVVLLAWVFFSKSYRVLAGAGVAMAASCAATWLMLPSAFSDYEQMMRSPGIEKEFIPCLSVALRLWLSPGTMMLQYLPVTLACAWALAYYWPRRHGWEWMRDGSLLMLVSIFAAPYCWLYDQGLAVPALLQGAYKTRFRWLVGVLALASVPIEIGLVCGVRITSALYLWTAPAWLAWYFFALAGAGRSLDCEAPIVRVRE